MTASQHIEKSTPAGDAGSKRKLTETRDPIDGQRESSIGGASQCDGEEHVNPNKKPKLLPPRSSSGHHRDADLSPTLLGENSKRSKDVPPLKHTMTMCNYPRNIKNDKLNSELNNSMEKQSTKSGGTLKASIEQRLDPSAKATCDPGEPPQKANQAPGLFVTEEQWRKELYKRDLAICDTCRIQLPDRLKRARNPKNGKDLDDGAKIEMGEKLLEKVKQECASGVCRGSPGALKPRSRVSKPKFERRDLGEGNLRLEVTGKKVDLSFPFGDAGKWFLASIQSWERSRAAEQYKSRAPLAAAAPNNQGTLTDHSSSAPSGLVGGDNPKLSALSESGRYESVEILQKHIHQCAESKTNHRFPKHKPDVLRKIALRVEGFAYRTSKSLRTYLNKIDVVIEALQGEKRALAVAFEGGSLRLKYDGDLFRSLKEPFLPKDSGPGREGDPVLVD